MADILHFIIEQYHYFVHFFESFVEHYGQIGIFLVTIGEHFIIPVPVDPLFTLGLAKGLDANIMVIWVILATFIGSLIGYYLGKYLGHPVAVRLFGKKNVDKGEEMINKWGIWGVIVTGLTPIPFQVMVWIAGIFEMPIKKFLLGTLIGRLPRFLFVIYASKWFFDNKIYQLQEMGALILGGIQGVTEFLPISSSGHLVVAQHFLSVPFADEQMVMFDIFLHGGSLAAIILYFWKDWWKLLKEIGGFFKKRKIDTQSLTFKLAVATIPAIIAGLALKDLIEGKLRNKTSVAIFFILVGIFFFYSAWKSKKNHSKKVSLKQAIIIGFTQALALIPGVSRSGSTIATGTILGIERKVAAKFSFMLGAIAILAANTYALLSLFLSSKDQEVLQAGVNTLTPDLNFTLIGFFSSFFFSLASVYFLMKFLEKYTLRTFGVYLILMGGVILSFL